MKVRSKGYSAVRMSVIVMTLHVPPGTAIRASNLHNGNNDYEVLTALKDNPHTEHFIRSSISPEGADTLGVST